MKKASISPLSQDMFLTGDLPEDLVGEADNKSMVYGYPFTFSSSDTPLMVMGRIMPELLEISPRTSGRLSHSSGLHIGSLWDRSPVSLSDMEDLEQEITSGRVSYGNLWDIYPQLSLWGRYPVSLSHKEDVKEHHSIDRSQSQNCPSTNHLNTQWGFTVSGGFGGGTTSSKTTARGLEDKKKEERRAQNAQLQAAQLQAAIAVAGVAAAVARTASAAAAAKIASAAATAGSGKDDLVAKTNIAVASAATLVAAQCVELAKAMGAKQEQLSAVVLSGVNVRSADDIEALTAVAASVIPVERGVSGGGGFSGELTEEILQIGWKLLKRTRQDDLHWKIVSVYINKRNKVTLMMKNTPDGITKKKNRLIAVIKDMEAWPGRQLLEGGENRRYFGLNTKGRGIVEFECQNQKEYDIWTQGVSRLLTIAGVKTTGRRT